MSPRPERTMRRLRYHQLLVSPRIGGAEKLAMAIHKYSEGMEPGSSELIVPAGSETQRWVDADGVACRTYDFERALGGGRFSPLRANLGLYLTLRRSGPGILHIHSPYVFAALRPLRAVSHLRTILHLHLDYTEELLRWSLRLAPDLVIVCARFMEERVERALAAGGPRKTRVIVAINAVDTSRFAPGDRSLAKREFGLDPNTPLLVVSANLAPHKGQETAIRAAAMLVARGFKPQLWLVGEEREAGGMYTKTLNELVKSLDLSSVVRFLGFRADVPRLLQAADFLLLPSIHEGLPLAILEAQAAKVVVLAAPTAGIPEVVEQGRTGFLIAADDPAGYAETLASLMLTPDRGRAVADDAYRHVVGGLNLNRYCQNMYAHHAYLLQDG